MQVDRINQKRIFWSGKYVNPNSKEYKTLEGESNYAVSSKENSDITVYKSNIMLNVKVFFAKLQKLYCVL